jgi:hypothetical protein
MVFFSGRRIPQFVLLIQLPVRILALRLIRKYEVDKSIHLNELVLRKPLVVSISHRGGELRLHNLMRKSTISKPVLNTVSSNASPGWIDRSVCFWGDDRGLLKEKVKINTLKERTVQPGYMHLKIPPLSQGLKLSNSKRGCRVSAPRFFLIWIPFLASRHRAYSDKWFLYSPMVYCLFNAFPCSWLQYS